MKTSDLIAALAQEITVNGDLPVRVVHGEDGHDDQMDFDVLDVVAGLAAPTAVPTYLPPNEVILVYVSQSPELTDAYVAAKSATTVVSQPQG